MLLLELMNCFQHLSNFSSQMAFLLLPSSWLHYKCPEIPLIFFHFYRIYWGDTSNKLYRLQVHNSTTHPLYTVLCVYHPRSSLHPSPFIPHLSWTMSHISQPSSSPLQSPHCCPCPWVFSLFFSLLLNPFTSPTSTHLTADGRLPSYTMHKNKL